MQDDGAYHLDAIFVSRGMCNVNGISLASHRQKGSFFYSCEADLAAGICHSNLKS